MNNPLYRKGIKPGTHRLGGVGVEKKVRIRDIVSSQALVDDKKVRKLARFTRNMPGKATVSWNGKNWVAKDGNHRLNAMLKQGKRKATVLVQKLSSQQPVIQFSIKKAGKEATDRIASALNNKVGMGWWNSGMPKKAIPLRVVEKDGNPHLLVYRRTASGGRDSMTTPVSGWAKEPTLSTSTNRESTKRYPEIYGRPGGQHSIGTYAIPESELGAASAHLGEQEIRHPNMAKFLVRVRSGNQKLSAKQEPIQFMHNTEHPSPIRKRRPIKPRRLVQFASGDHYVKYNPGADVIQDPYQREHFRAAMIRKKVPLDEPAKAIGTRPSMHPGSGLEAHRAKEKVEQMYRDAREGPMGQEPNPPTYKKPHDTPPGHFDPAEAAKPQPVIHTKTPRQQLRDPRQAFTPEERAQRQAMVSQRAAKTRDPYAWLAAAKKFPDIEQLHPSLKVYTQGSRGATFGPVIAQKGENFLKPGKAIRDQSAKYEETLQREAQHFRDLRAQELRGKRAFIQEVRGIKGPPDLIDQSWLEQQHAKNAERSARVPRQIAEGVRPYKASATKFVPIGGKHIPNLPKVLDTLSSHVESETHRKSQDLQRKYMGVRGTIRTRIGHSIASGGILSDQDKRGVDTITKHLEPMTNRTAMSPEQTEELARHLRVKPATAAKIPERLKSMRDKFDSAEGIANIRKTAMRDFLTSPTPKIAPSTYVPGRALRNVGIGAGVAVLGGLGLYAGKKIIDHRKQQQQKQLAMSSRGRLIQFGRGAYIIPKIGARLPWLPKLGKIAEEGMHPAEKEALKWTTMANLKRNSGVAHPSRENAKNLKAAQAAAAKAQAAQDEFTKAVVSRDTYALPADILAAERNRLAAFFKGRSHQRSIASGRASLKSGRDAAYLKGREQGQQSGATLAADAETKAKSATDWAHNAVQSERRDAREKISNLTDHHANETAHRKRAALGTLIAGTAGAGTAGYLIGRPKKQQVQQFKSKDLEPWQTAGLSAAASGGVLGAIPAFRTGSTFKGSLKGIATGAGLGALLGGGGTYIGTKLLGKPKRNDPTAITKRAALGGSIAGLGLGSLGVAALRRGKRLPGIGTLDEAAKNWRPANFIRSSGAPLAIGTGALIGAAIAGAHATDEGQQVDTLRNLRKPIRMSSRSIPIRFAMQKPAVAQDRYRKQIHEKDEQRAESNYLRSAGAGAALAAVLRKHTKLPFAANLLTGAGAGLAAQAATRMATSQTKDQFGERSYNAKKVEKLPWIGAGLTAAGIVAHRGYRKAYPIAMNRNGKLIQFGPLDEYAQATAEPRYRRTYGQADALYSKASRAGRLGRDLKYALTGQENLDERGRKRKSEWDKPWVKRAAIATAGAGALIIGHKLRGGVARSANEAALAGHEAGPVGKFMQKLWHGHATKAVRNKVSSWTPEPVKSAGRKIGGFFGDLKRDISARMSGVAAKANEAIEDSVGGNIVTVRVGKNGLAKVRDTSTIGEKVASARAAAQKAEAEHHKAAEALKTVQRQTSSPAEAVRSAASGEWKKKNNEDSKIIRPTFMSSKSTAIRFDWDIQPLSRNTARISLPGYNDERKQRRSKHWYEKKAVREAALAAGVIGAAGIGWKVRGSGLKAAAVAHDAGAAISEAEKMRKLYEAKSAIGLSNIQNLTQLSSLLDSII